VAAAGEVVEVAEVVVAVGAVVEVAEVVVAVGAVAEAAVEPVEVVVGPVEVVVGPAEAARDVVHRVAAGPAEVGPARRGCRADPGARSAHALLVIPQSPISPAPPALTGTARTAAPA